MELVNTSIKTYKIDKNYYYDIVTTDRDYEGWFYHREYGIKMFTCLFRRELFSFEDAEKHFLEDDIESKKESYLRLVSGC